MIHRCVRLLVCLLLVGIVTACHRTELPPVDGVYVFADGQDAQLQGGRFIGTMAGRGNYAVEGAHVTLRLDSGPRLEGERLDADHFQLTQKDGQSMKPVDLYRAGSPDALEGKRTLATRLGRPIPTDAERDAQAAQQKAAIDESAFVPDASVPMDRYTPIDHGTDLKLVEAAFAAPALTDEQLLALLLPGYASEPDAFKKKDMATHALPDLTARVSQAREQHYYSISVQTLPADWSAPHVPALLLPYDLSRQGFPIFAGSNACFSRIDSSNFVPRAVHVSCLFAVDDEAIARRAEAARTVNGAIVIEGRVFFCITQANRFEYALPVEVLHAHLTIRGVTDPSLRVDRDL
jgi:hypothetical protein